MDLLHDHVPLTLLVDLVDAPASEEVLVEEGLPDQEWWEQVPHAGGADRLTRPGRRTGFSGAVRALVPSLPHR